MIKEQYCCVARVKDIENAEKLCRAWNNFNNTMKVHIHPYSYTMRENPEQSSHLIFRKQSELLKSASRGFFKEEQTELSMLMNSLNQLN